MLYFAYGSNLDWKRIKKRCPSASFYCKIWRGQVFTFDINRQTPKSKGSSF